MLFEVGIGLIHAGAILPPVRPRSSGSGSAGVTNDLRKSVSYSLLSSHAMMKEAFRANCPANGREDATSVASTIVNISSLAFEDEFRKGFWRHELAWDDKKCNKGRKSGRDSRISSVGTYRYGCIGIVLKTKPELLKRLRQVSDLRGREFLCQSLLEASEVPWRLSIFCDLGGLRSFGELAERVVRVVL